MRTLWSCNPRTLVRAFLWRLFTAIADATLTVTAFITLGRWAFLLFGVAFAVAWWRIDVLCKEDQPRFQAMLTLDRTFGQKCVDHVPRWARLLLALMLIGIPVWLIRTAICGAELAQHPLHVRVVDHTLLVYDDEALKNAQACLDSTPETARDAVLRSIAEAHQRGNGADC